MNNTFNYTRIPEKDNPKRDVGRMPDRKRKREFNPLFGFLTRGVILLAAIFLMPFTGSAQQNANEAEWNGNGYFLKKIVSNTSIQSGVNFSYTIMFSAPAGATNIVVQDEVPGTLDVVSVPTPSPVNGVTPTVNISGQTVTYSLNSLPPGSAASGSFTIVVRFPEGTTCNGDAARNRAGIRINDQWNYTPYVSTTAIAENPWEVSKSIISGPVVNPNGGSCGYVMAEGDTVTYRLSVVKKSPFYGNVVGQQNMNNAVVTDVLPPGAVFVSSSCGVTPPLSGNTFSWSPNGGLLDAATPWAYYSCDITVYYPAGSFPNGTFINNEATLDGEMCGQQVAHTSNETCIEVGQVTVDTSAFFRKYVYMTNRVPGCNGYYRIAFKNTGTGALSAFNIEDVVPSGVSVNSVRVFGGSSTTTMALTANSGGNTIASQINTNFFDSGSLGFTVNDLQWQMTGSLPAGDWINMYIYFTVQPNPPGTVVENCASFDGLANNLTLQDACVSFTVAEGEPKPCVLKEVCSPEDSYEPGDVLRFRLRVQNIGSADISGATIQDALHSNFTYVGNETYYTINDYNPSCAGNGNIPAGATSWGGVSPNHNGNNLQWSLPDIDSDCQLFYVGYCGYYGTWGLPFHFIEFDVRVDSTAMPGVTPNQYEISGGNLASAVTSNTAHVLVVASFGQEVKKQVSAGSGSGFASSGTVNAGGTARFRLNYKNTSNVPVTDVGLVDLLARNDGTDDWLVLDRSTSRGSQFDLNYGGNHTTSLLPAATAPPVTLSYAGGQNVCLPGFGVTAGCNSSSWGSAVDQNVRMTYGSFLLGPGISLQEEFDVTVPAGAPEQQKACNDFAAVSTSSFLLDGAPQSVALTPIAAPPVCLTVDSEGTGKCCENIKVEAVQDPDLGECCARLVTECEVDSVVATVSNGTFSSASWNCGSIPAGFAGQTTHTFDANGCAIDLLTCVSPDSTGIVAVNYVIHLTNGEVCEQQIRMDCKAQDPPPSDCCAQVDFKLKPKWPYWGTLVGTFDITNLDPASPICSVTISANPSGNFNPGNLIIDGATSSQNWNATSIPATGSLSPGAVNEMQFSLISSNYKGTVTVCVQKCDGTKCCFEFNWNRKPLVDVGVEIDQADIGKKLVAVRVKPELTTNITEKVKYVSFGFFNEEVLGGESRFFAIAAGGGDCDDDGRVVHPGAAYMGKHNAFFDLSCPWTPAEGKGSPTFNLVVEGDLPEIGCALFDAEGNEVFSGKIDVASPDTVISSLNQLGEASGSMFEFLNLYPNPSNGSFRVTYATGNREDVELRLINTTGQTLRIFRPREKGPGVHNLDLDLRGLAAGMYRVLLYSGEDVKGRTVVIDP